MKLPFCPIAWLIVLLVVGSGCHQIISHKIDQSFRAVNESLKHSVHERQDSMMKSMAAAMVTRTFNGLLLHSTAPKKDSL